MYRFLLTRRWLGYLALTVAAAMVMTVLGYWQLSRYQERSEINARIDAAETAEPLPLPAVLAAPAPGEGVGPEPAADAGYAQVRVSGRYDPEAEVLIRARSVQSQVGYEVVTPLVLADGTSVLVNRGWIPPAESGMVAAPEVPVAPAGEVTVTGWVRAGEPGPRPVERHEGVLQTRRINLESISEHVPHPLYAGYLQLVEQSPPADERFTPIPVQRENTVLNAAYAVQWWIFVALVLGGFGYFVRQEARQSRASPPTTAAAAAQ